MLETLFAIPLEHAALIAISTASIFITVITYTRIAGLRSFSKMSGFDFAMTIAIGSLIATVAVTRSSLIEGMIALGVLYILQIIIAILRRKTLFQKIIDNTPVLLMQNGEFLWDNMRASRITKHDVLSKLRSNNVKDITGVQAVVLETTGDISVLHGDKLNDDLLEGVRR